MVVHHNHFVEELMIPVILLVEILDCFDIGRVSNQMRKDIAVHTDSPDDGHIFLLVLGPLHNQGQHWALRLPDLRPSGPAIRRGLIHVDYLSAFHHKLENLLDERNSQLDHLLFTPGTVETAVDLQIADVELLITVR